jgi:hypothetical protein
VVSCMLCLYPLLHTLHWYWLVSCLSICPYLTFRQVTVSLTLVIKLFQEYCVACKTLIWFHYNGVLKCIKFNNKKVKKKPHSWKMTAD